MCHINCGKKSGRNTDAATAKYPDNVLLWRPGENGRFYVTDTDFFIFIGGSTMRNKKGFTLVELVIVIAVIAILAGVMIGTFASVVKKANESRKAQEMAAAKTEQTANDVIEKLNNSNWLGWEDFETSLVAKMTEAYKNTNPNKQTDINVLQEAVKSAVAKYFAENANENTGLTAEQVKYIVETAVAKNAYVGVTAEQVKAIVNSAVSGTSTLTKSQVQQIVDAAQARNLTAAQVAKAIADAKLATTDDVSAKIDTVLAAINEVSAKALTEKQVQDIVNAAVWNAGGVTKTWFDDTTYATKKEYTVSSAEEVAGLATLVNGGYNFEGKTITLVPAKGETAIDLSKSGNWTPIGNTRGNEFKGTITGGATPVVIKGLTLNEQFNAVRNGYLINCTSTGNMDKVGVGFVSYLGKNATLSNIVFEDVNINITDAAMDGICVGVAVGYLDGGTIENVTIRKSSDVKAVNEISGVYRMGGLVGAAAKGTIKNVTINNLTVQSKGLSKEDGHCVAGALIGYARDFADDSYKDLDVSISEVKLNDVTVKVRSIDTMKKELGSYADSQYYYSIVGTCDNISKLGTGIKATIADLATGVTAAGVEVVEAPNDYVK